MEENDTVQEALKRLPPKVAYDRVYRLRRAVQCSLAHTILPKEEQTKPEQVLSLLAKGESGGGDSGMLIDDNGRISRI